MQAISLAVAPVSPAMIHPAHAMGVFRRNERFERDDGRDPGTRSIEAAARLGVLMAQTSQRGFEVFTVHGGRPPLPPFRPPDIRSEILARLSLVANPERSSILLRVGELCWMGRLLGGLGGARRVCGRVLDGWTGDMCGCVGEMGGAVVAVGMVEKDAWMMLAV